MLSISATQGSGRLRCWRAGMLGGVFFGGLWWTVRRGGLADAGALVPRQPRPAHRHRAGRLLRRGCGQPLRLGLCLLGFLLARAIVLACHTTARRRDGTAMRLTPDAWIFWQHGFFKLNATIVFTWALMAVLVIGAALITRRLATGHERSRWQNLLEIVVTAIVGRSRTSA
jgi:hypothetical protein